jgi:hypothetical protein
MAYRWIAGTKEVEFIRGSGHYEALVIAPFDNVVKGMCKSCMNNGSIVLGPAP